MTIMFVTKYNFLVSYFFLIRKKWIFKILI